MKREEVFEPLHAIIVEESPVFADTEIGARTDLLPIEGTADGWFCLTNDLKVIHVSSEDCANEVVASPRQATALLGSLVRRFPLATAVLPPQESIQICPTCHGRCVAWASG